MAVQVVKWSAVFYAREDSLGKENNKHKTLEMAIWSGSSLLKESWRAELYLIL